MLYFVLINKVVFVCVFFVIVVVVLCYFIFIFLFYFSRNNYRSKCTRTLLSVVCYSCVAPRLSLNGIKKYLP